MIESNRMRILFCFLISIINVLSYSNFHKNVINQVFFKIKNEIKTEDELKLIELFKQELIIHFDNNQKINDFVKFTNDIVKKRNLRGNIDDNIVIKKIEGSMITTEKESINKEYKDL